MRAGPLSDSKVISLLNRYYVPVYVSNENFEPGGAASPEERGEYDRFVRESAQKGMGSGEVHVYILGPDGHAIDGETIGRATETALLLPVLERVIQRLNTTPGGPVVTPKPQSAPPHVASGSMAFHLVARGFQQGTWREFPAENWIVLSRPEWSSLLPKSGSELGASWDIDEKIAARLMVNFYPQTADVKADSSYRNRIDRQSLRFTLIPGVGGVSRCRIEGLLRMMHPSNPSVTDKSELFVDARLLGFMDFDPDTRRIQRLCLVTTKAAYSGMEFGAALRSLAPSPTQ